MAAVLSALLASMLLVTLSSRGFFFDTTANASNQWTTGSVEITDDDSGNAMFNANDLGPDEEVKGCIEVTYLGSLEASVKLYGTASGDLAPYLNLTIEVGEDGVFNDCEEFDADATLYDGTLAGFAAANTDFASGLGTWAPTGTGQSKSYRFTVSVQDDNAAQAKSATATFTWEARST